jgi:hypothetical protein
MSHYIQILDIFTEEEIKNHGKRFKEACDYHNLKISNTFSEQ